MAYEPTRVLENIDLEIGSGEIYTIIGPSGCGKSTFLGAIAGLVKGVDGEIFLNGEKICTKKHTIGLIPQHYGLLPWKTVYENIVLAHKIRGFQLSEEKKAAEIEGMLEKLKILPFKKRYPGELSGGQKQRVAIARAFSLKPDLLLMDEPFSALDALTREATRELFLELWRENRATTLFITHDVDEAVALGTKIVLMSPPPGRILRVFDNDRSDGLAAEIRRLMREVWD